MTTIPRITATDAGYRAAEEPPQAGGSRMSTPSATPRCADCDVGEHDTCAAALNTSGSCCCGVHTVAAAAADLARATREELAELGYILSVLEHLCANPDIWPDPRDTPPAKLSA